MTQRGYVDYDGNGGGHGGGGGNGGGGNGGPGGSDFWSAARPWLIGAAVASVCIGVPYEYFGGRVTSKEIGVRIHNGAVGGVVNPGLHFVVPFMDSIATMPTTFQTAVTTVAPASRENAEYTAEVHIQYQLDPSMIGTIYKEGGLDYVVNQRLIPNVTTALKAVTPGYSIDQTPGARDQIATQTLDMVQAQMAKFGIKVSAIQLVNFNLGAQYNRAVQKKLEADQNRLAAQSNAEAAITLANGEARATLIRASADGKANVLRDKGLSPTLIQYLLAQKWNGVSPLSTSGNTLLNVGNNGLGGK